ncbi:hypothetical protein [Streptosporangium sp. NPDC087985]|uniref:hypothetical protein n=1 Tax=Streptosporangium sp. NPDC087985 TaxID=3366196 RepID=UPI0037FB2953
MEVSDSLLSKRIITLEEAGYVRVEKASVGKRPPDLADPHRRGTTGVSGLRLHAETPHRRNPVAGPVLEIRAPSGR